MKSLILSLFMLLPLSANADTEALILDLLESGIEWKQQALLGWTSLCQDVGEVRMGSFTAHGKRYTYKALVGDKDNRCIGRCGSGCGGGLLGSFGPDNVYTQECLNHDICHRVTGDIFGECKDEFVKAIHGFKQAPECF